MSQGAEKVCSAGIELSQFVAKRLLSPPSNWTFSEGRYTGEFSQAPHMASNVSVSRTCIRLLSSQLLTDADQAALQEAIRIRATSYLNSFITEHQRAFITAKGPATDVVNFSALIVSTALSVLLASSAPFPNFMLKIICKFRPQFLDDKVYQLRCGWCNFKVLCLAVFNMLLSVCIFLPVLYLAWSEDERQMPFYTWDLSSADQNIYNSLDNEVLLRIIYLFSATSEYDSQFITASSSVVAVIGVFVAIRTCYRCKMVIRIYGLLQRYESSVKGADTIREDKKVLLARALRAIGMTEVEYMDTEDYVEKIDCADARPRQQQLARVQPQNNLINAPTDSIDGSFSNSSQIMLLPDNMDSSQWRHE